MPLITHHRPDWSLSTASLSGSEAVRRSRAQRGRPGIGCELTDETLLARTGEDSRAAGLIALNTKDGRQRWRIDLPPTMLVGSDLRAAINGDHLAYVAAPGEGGTHRTVHVNDARTGKPLWLAAGAEDLLGLGTDWLITKASEGAERIQLFDPR